MRFDWLPLSNYPPFAGKFYPLSAAVGWKRRKLHGVASSQDDTTPVNGQNLHDSVSEKSDLVDFQVRVSLLRPCPGHHSHPHGPDLQDPGRTVPRTS